MNEQKTLKQENENVIINIAKNEDIQEKYTSEQKAVARGKIYEFEEIYSLLPDDVKRHSKNVSLYSCLLYNKACEFKNCEDFECFKNDEAIDSKYIPIMSDVFRYHDLGKILVPKNILNAEGVLEIDDLRVYKDHSKNTNPLFWHAFAHRSTLKMSPTVLDFAYDAAIGHHERWDGKGYPCGWAGTNIPTLARICAVADTYEAITSGRSYKESASHNFAVREINKNVGTQFDKKVVELLIACSEEFRTTLRMIKNINTTVENKESNI